MRMPSYVSTSFQLVDKRLDKRQPCLGYAGVLVVDQLGTGRHVNRLASWRTGASTGKKTDPRPSVGWKISGDPLGSMRMPSYVATSFQLVAKRLDKRQPCLGYAGVLVVDQLETGRHVNRIIPRRNEASTGKKIDPRRALAEKYPVTPSVRGVY